MNIESKTKYRPIIVAHIILSLLAYLIIFPIGIYLALTCEDKRAHKYVQTFGFLVAILAISLAVVGSTEKAGVHGVVGTLLFTVVLFHFSLAIGRHSLPKGTWIIAHRIGGFLIVTLTIVAIILGVRVALRTDALDIVFMAFINFRSLHHYLLQNYI